MKNDRKKGFGKRLLALLLAGAMALSVTACGAGTGESSAPVSSTVSYSASEKETIQWEFLSLCDEILVEVMENEYGPYINATVIDPEKLGIDREVAGQWPDLSQESSRDYDQAKGEFSRRLEEIDRAALTAEQQTLYDQIREMYDWEGITEEPEETVAVDNLFDSTNGVQGIAAQILKTYVLRDKTDIENYFRLIRGIPDYFADALAFTEEQSKQKLLPNDVQLDAAIAQCESYGEKTEDYFVTSSFGEQIDEADFLTEAEKASYKAENEKLMDEYYFPSYASLKASLESMKERDEEQRPDRICDMEDGKAYYESLLRDNGSTDRTPEEAFDEIEAYLDDLLRRCRKVRSNPDYEAFQVSEEDLDPRKLLEKIKTSITEDFPEMVDVEYTTQKIDPAEEAQNGVLAYFVMPPIDGQETMRMYFGSRLESDPNVAAESIMHEGIPGHMYRAAIRSEESVHPLEKVISYLGSSEGWARYVEFYCMKYLGATEEDVTMEEFGDVGTVLYNLCDIGVHYKGWTSEDVKSYLQEKLNMDGETAENYAHSYYNQIVASPACMLCYTVGLVETLELKAQAKELLGDRYTDKLFHTFLVESGERSFPVLREKLKEFASEQTADAEKAA